VNLGSSIYLASRFGAIGVALGTVLGSFTGVALHFAISMHLTQPTLAISRSRLLLAGLLRPSLVAIPSVVLLPLWWPTTTALSLRLTLAWGLCTLALAWFCGLNGKERNDLMRLSRSLLLRPSPH
jgi:hypothetical protein